MEELKRKLLASVPHALVIEDFLGPAEIAYLYAQTRLNVHPCLYDAYGMTIVEAASQVLNSPKDCALIFS